MSNLQPLKWHEQQGWFSTKSPLTEYQVALCGEKYRVLYTKRSDGFAREATGFATVEDAKEWAWNHYNEKMQPYIRADSITDIANWFYKAKPEPTIDDLCVQIGCHLEEVCELLEALGVINQTATDDLPYLSNAFKRKDSRCLDLINNLTYQQRIDIVDACCDTNVTGTGIMTLLGGVNVLGAQREVIRSNNSKMIDGKFEFDANGKIMKPASYSKPDLTKFVEVTK